jgi:CubicO group peptidase (beta-lactamase class C family)
LRWAQLKKRIARERPSRRRTALYSDLDLWMMGAYLEAVRESSLLAMWDQVHERLDLGEIFFHPFNKPRHSRKRYAPTESCPWRHKVLQGEVHDDNTWALGGVAPHAGLFGSVEAVSDWGLKLRAAVLKDDRLFGDPRMVRKFTSRQIPRSVGDWGLGFMKPSRPKSSCGRYFSLQSFGHTGFTGTSLWIDPVRDLQVVILSNRVHPTRDNTRFQGLRPQLHDWVCQQL